MNFYRGCITNRDNVLYLTMRKLLLFLLLPFATYAQTPGTPTTGGYTVGGSQVSLYRFGTSSNAKVRLYAGGTYGYYDILNAIDPNYFGTLTGGSDARIRLGPNSTGVGKISVNGEYTEMNKHTFDDYSTIISSQTGLGYASYDASAYLIGSTVNDHFAAYQGRMKYGGSGGINGNLGITSFYSRPEHTGTGMLQNHQGVLIDDIAGNGPVQNSTGILILPITRGNQNYSIYTNAGRVHLGDKLDVVGDVVATGSGAVFGLEDQNNPGQFWTEQVNNGVLNIGSVNEQKIHMSISKFGNVSVNGLFFANTTTNTFGIATGSSTATNLKFTGTGGTSGDRPAIQAFKNGSDPNQLLTLQEGGGMVAIGKTTDDGSGALLQLGGRANGVAAVNATDFVIKQQVRVQDANGNSNWAKRTVTTQGNELILDDNGTQWWWRHILNGTSTQDAATLATDGNGNRSFTMTATSAVIP